jgi:DNA-binding NarL/FixJ family response regulator
VFVILEASTVRIAQPISLTEEQRVKLESYARGRSIAKRLVERAEIVLLAAQGKQDIEIAEALKIKRQTAA